MSLKFPIAKMRSLRGRIVIGICFMAFFYLILLVVYLNIKDPVTFKRNGTNASTQSKIRKLELQYVVVHLDLKGAPPNLNYLKSLLPMIKKRGANAVLIEYEDMFPYDKHLVNLSAPNCYNKDELRQFLIDADILDMEVIPLIQTFGHLEFVLKHDEFKHLREDPEYPDSICPSKNETLSLIRSMLQQVISLHDFVTPLKHIHIGCDEVFASNQCPDCKKLGDRNRYGKTALTLSHITRVAGFVKELSNTTKVLIWDDMMRGIKPTFWQYLHETTKKRFDIVEPVYWDYEPEISLLHTALRYYHLNFDNIWVASSFKGSDGALETLPNIADRFANNYNWMRLLYNYKFGGEKEVYKFKGIILTGWSRYAHFSPLSELLPLSIPSLFINLDVIKRFRTGFHETDVLDDNWSKMLFRYFYVDIKNDLQCPFLIEDPDFSICNFDSVQLYRVVRTFTSLNKLYLKRLSYDGDTIMPTLNYYLMKNFGDRRMLEVTVQQLLGMKRQLNEVKQEMSYYLARFYDRVIINEYVGAKTHEATTRIENLIKAIRNVIGYKKVNFSNIIAPVVGSSEGTTTTLNPRNKHEMINKFFSVVITEKPNTQKIGYSQKLRDHSVMSG